MGDINFDLFRRYLLRADEIANEADMSVSVKSVYLDILKPKAIEYLALDAAVTAAESAWAKEHREATDAIEALDEPYRTARAVLSAYHPELVLPETLKALPTDTDKMHGVEGVIDKVDDHAGTAWADDILLGPLGTKGVETVREIKEAIAADKTVAKAKEKRATAYGPTYDAFIRWKRVVRSALGPASRQYRRIHGRNSEQDVEGGGPTPPTPGPTPGPTDPTT